MYFLLIQFGSTKKYRTKPTLRYSVNSVPLKHMTVWRHLLFWKCEILRMTVHFSPSCLGLKGNLGRPLNLILQVLLNFFFNFKFFYDASLTIPIGALFSYKETGSYRADDPSSIDDQFVLFIRHNKNKKSNFKTKLWVVFSHLKHLKV